MNFKNHPIGFSNARDHGLYRAFISYWRDGDTVVVLADLGHNARHEVPIRLLDVSAPEIRGAEKEKGREAMRYMQDRIPDGTPCSFPTKTKKSFDRYVGELLVYVEDEWLDAADILRTSGHAE